MNSVPVRRALLALALLTAAVSLPAQSQRAAEQSSINRNHGTARATRSLNGAQVAAMEAQNRAQAEVADSTSTVTLSKPDQPCTLRIDMPWADIKVQAVDGDTVTVQSTVQKKATKAERRPGSLRRLDNEVSFELSEKDNVVTLSLAGESSHGAFRGAEFKISVPRQMALDLKATIGGDIEVKNVEGDVTVENLNGEVTLEGLVGATIVNTMNGEVRAVYAKTPTKPINIASMNGEVDLRVPADTKANVSLRTHNGSILTDFDEEVLKTKTEGKSSGRYSYSYSADTETRQAVREAAQVARAAVQEAMQVAREVATEVQQAMAEADAAAAEAADAADAVEALQPPKPAKVSRAPKAPRAPMPPITGGKLVSGTLNGGGIDIKVSTMNGEITLRQLTAAQ